MVVDVDAFTWWLIAAVFAVGLASAAWIWIKVVLARRAREREVAPTVYFPNLRRMPRHALIKEVGRPRYPVRKEARPRWWTRWRRGSQPEPLVDIRTSVFAEELAALGHSDAQAEADGPHLLPGQR